MHTREAQMAVAAPCAKQFEEAVFATHAGCFGAHATQHELLFEFDWLISRAFPSHPRPTFTQVWAHISDIIRRA